MFSKYLDLKNTPSYSCKTGCFLNRSTITIINRTMWTAKMDNAHVSFSKNSSNISAKSSMGYISFTFLLKWYFSLFVIGLLVTGIGVLHITHGNMIISNRKSQLLISSAATYCTKKTAASSIHAEMQKQPKLVFA